MRRPSALLLLAVLLSGCSVFETPRTLRGNRVDADQLRELVPGTSTRTDVTSLLGSPTAKATFDDNQWIYISELTRIRIGRTPGVLQQDVVVLTFDQGGVLRTIQRLGQDDALPVAVVSRTTPSPGSEASFLQQLLGNVGRFNAGGASANTGGSGASFGTGSGNRTAQPSAGL